MLSLPQLNSFLAVVRAGSFVGAADATGLSKAAVSRHVAELEAQLGIRSIDEYTYCALRFTGLYRRVKVVIPKTEGGPE